MTTVWKYPIALDDGFALTMPEGAEALYVAVQDGAPCLWARGNPMQPPTVRRFRVAGTGHSLDEHVGRYVGSFMFHRDTLVFHVFEAAP